MTFTEWLEKQDLFVGFLFIVCVFIFITMFFMLIGIYLGFVYFVVCIFVATGSFILYQYISYKKDTE
jgi:hypothetical protein